ncbi:uncharacterized protein BHQ10_003532 [Talaromyces amestolkiae]|uniref:Zn(2)-C6 fungal-type domain-containing protein n=1 Tax=Talaromyces amestolkiae TaxID=1196081 RepID=A0A364KVD7_TALAM|nr:uncharacterized protein BHQ10_003532 [Talaromyces amestolkiae]RAO67520.1 hypothetical protein BHQ10_003532 [Talaromyces amestolkiae]
MLKSSFFTLHTCMHMSIYVANANYGVLQIMPKRGRTGCLTCRRRHLKCDEEKPVCGRCRRTARECIPDDLLTFRDSQKVAARAQLRSNGSATAALPRDDADNFQDEPENDRIFAEDHQWLATPSKLSFVDETSIVTAEYRHQHTLSDVRSLSGCPPHRDHLSPVSTPVAQQSLSTQVSSSHPAAVQHNTTSPGANNASFPRRDGSFSVPGLGLGGLGLPTTAASSPCYLHMTSPHQTSSSAPLHGSDQVHVANQSGRLSHVSPEMLSSPEALHRKVGLLLYEDRMLLPFKVPQEALLFHHYMEALAAFLDITDIQRHFAVDVPELALSCPVLLNALMAFSARHLSRTTDFDSAVADHYHHECVSLIIPMLDQKYLVADETLFAAAVILRAFEETNESQMGTEPEHHLTGTSVFANAQLEFRTWGGLGHAAFWLFVRQDIYMSVLIQRPLKVDLAGWEDRLSFDLGFNATTDCTWANRMTWIVAEIVSFCFGDRLSYVNWEAARAKTERWNLTRPPSFDPILYIERDEDAGKYFPEIRLGHPWHVTGNQYYYIAKLFLAIYNPVVPRIGLGYQRHRKSISDEVLRNAEAVCGIASATSLVAARLTARTAIIACGPWFHDRPRAEQELLLQLLKRTEMESALPTESLIQGLMVEWGW